MTEGRDQGTVVFPRAACKFFLTASPRARAERRMRDLQARGTATTIEQVLADQEERDGRDAHRKADPMVPAADAVVIDTSGLDADAVLDMLEETVRRCPAG